MELDQMICSCVPKFELVRYVPMSFRPGDLWVIARFVGCGYIDIFCGSLLPDVVCQTGSHCEKRVHHGVRIFGLLISHSYKQRFLYSLHLGYHSKHFEEEDVFIHATDVLAGVFLNTSGFWKDTLHRCALCALFVLNSYSASAADWLTGAACRHLN